MREGWRLWFLFAGLCVVGPVLAALYWQQSPQRPVLVTASDGKAGVQAVLNEAASLLESFQQRYGHLPCPVGMKADSQQFDLSEATLAAQRFCDDSLALEYGVMTGRLPWRALGMIKDPGLFYRVPQDAVDSAACHLSAPARIAMDEAGLDDAATGNGRSLVACAAPADPAVIPVHWNMVQKEWQSTSIKEVKLPVPPQADGVQTMLSADGQWLVLLDARNDDEGIRWVRWWHLNADGRQWIPIGRWHVPEMASVHQLQFSGNRVFVAHSTAEGARIADVPLWPRARGVYYQELPARAAFQSMAALPDGRGLMIKQANMPWQLMVMDAPWAMAVQADYWPEFSATMIGARLSPSGMQAVAWDARGALQFWTRHAGIWQKSVLPLAKSHRLEVLPQDVVWQEDEQMLYVWDNDHWHGWDTQTMKPLGGIRSTKTHKTI